MAEPRGGQAGAPGLLWWGPGEAGWRLGAAGSQAGTCRGCEGPPSSVSTPTARATLVSPGPPWDRTPSDGSRWPEPAFPPFFSRSALKTTSLAVDAALASGFSRSWQVAEPALS